MNDGKVGGRHFLMRDSKGLIAAITLISCGFGFVVRHVVDLALADPTGIIEAKLYHDKHDPMAREFGPSERLQDLKEVKGVCAWLCVRSCACM